jgi:hypothetical protein
MIYPGVRHATVAAIAGLTLLCAPTFAEARLNGQLSGSISSQNGAPLPGVHVTVHGAVDRAADTDAAGGFAFSDLPDGGYEISAELSGFERTHRVVRVRGNEPVAVSLTLR